MNWFDVAVLLFLGFFAIAGYRRGLVGQLFGLAGTVVALVLAFGYFGQLGGLLTRYVPIGAEFCEILAFILIVAVIHTVFVFAGSRWRNLTKSHTISHLDSVAGAAFGGLKGLLFLVIIIVILVSLPLPSVRQEIEKAPLANRILHTAPVFYFLQEKALPANVPRLLITSQGVQLRRINFADLDGAHCLRCGQPVKYEGFVRKGLLFYPKFVCPNCGLTSDGCLTYEGYHLIYGECPLDRANKGETLNCSVWPNPVPVSPHGPCPVCGQK